MNMTPKWTIATVFHLSNFNHTWLELSDLLEEKAYNGINNRQLSVENAKYVERLVHAELAEYRVNKKKEFFSCSVERAIECIEANQQLGNYTQADLQAVGGAVNQPNSTQVHHYIIDHLSKKMTDKAIVMLLYMMRHSLDQVEFTRRELYEDAGSHVGRENFELSITQLIAEGIVKDNNDEWSITLNKEMFFGDGSS